MKQKVLSVFIDESGDFGKPNPQSPYYYVAMVFHEQLLDISDAIKNLDEHIQQQDFCSSVFHAGPLIRREQIYKHETMEKRKALFNSLFHFARKVSIHYICPKINKLKCAPDVHSYIARLSRTISDELKKYLDYLNSFDLLINYYDYGQNELSKVIIAVFNTLFANVEFRKVKPADYKLFQVADLICTMELTNDKAERNEFSRSEREFFHSPRDFRKNLYKQLVKKKL